MIEQLKSVIVEFLRELAQRLIIFKYLINVWSESPEFSVSNLKEALNYFYHSNSE